MVEITACAYLRAALLAPLSIPLVLLLIGQWRFSRKAVYGATGVLYVMFVGLNAAALALWGCSVTSGTVVGWVGPVLCWLSFLFFSPYRDGRLLFTVSTVLIICSSLDILANVFTQNGTPASVVCLVVLFAIMYLLTALLIRKPFLRMVSSKSIAWVRVSILPLTLWATLLINFTAPYVMYREHPAPLAACSMLLSIIFIYVMLHNMVRSIQQRQHLNEGRAVLHTQMRQIERLTEKVRANDLENRTFRHDVRHYLNLLQYSVSRGDMETCNEVLRTLGSNINAVSEHYGIRNYTGDTILDTVLTTTAEQAEALGIDLEVSLLIPEFLEVDRTELAVVVSNALENALHACKAMPEDGPTPRCIRISSSCETKQFFLSIQNTYIGEVQFDPVGHFPITNRRHHGYGTQSITAFAQKYDAMLHYETSDGWFRLNLLM